MIARMIPAVMKLRADTGVPSSSVPRTGIPEHVSARSW